MKSLSVCKNLVRLRSLDGKNVALLHNLCKVAFTQYSLITGLENPYHLLQTFSDGFTVEFMFLQSNCYLAVFVILFRPLQPCASIIWILKTTCYLFIYVSSTVFSSRNLNQQFLFYRAMHFSAKRGIAIACCLSVCLSVCL